MTTSGHNVGLEEEKPMNDTPRTNAAWETTPSVYDFIVEMKRIERELNAANQRIKRLEEVGDAHLEWVPVSFQAAWRGMSAQKKVSPKSVSGTSVDPDTILNRSGMTLRDYFAAAALPQVDQRSHGTLDEIALECYQIADAMLAAREVKP